MTSVIIAIGALIPLTPLGPYPGFTKLPAPYWLLMVLTLIAYMLLTQAVKTSLTRRAWI